MVTSDKVVRTEQAIVRLCHDGLDSRTLRIEMLRQLRQLIPVDSFWFATADPATLLFTSSVVEEIPESATPSFVRNEFQEGDVNKWVDLARAPRPVNSLYIATASKPQVSARYREILAPLGMGDELRAVLRDGASSWGFMCLHREQGAPAFTPEEASILARLAPHAAHGLRTALLLGQVEDVPESEGPALLVLAEDLSVVATTAAASIWLEELADWPRRSELPQAIQGVVARLRALDVGQSDLVPRARVRARSGQWLLLHASRLSTAAGSDRIAVVMERAQPLDVAPLLLRAYELTDRESEIALLVVRGSSTAEIAAQLFISPLTVQQHLKAVFDKTGVSSRRELVAQIFARDFLPRLQRSHSQ